MKILLSSKSTRFIITGNILLFSVLTLWLFCIEKQILAEEESTLQKNFLKELENAEKALYTDCPENAEKMVEKALLNYPKISIELKKKASAIIKKSKLASGMVYIPAGQFLMGNDDKDALEHEKFLHTQYIRSFFIDRHEVTNAQYFIFLSYINRTKDHSFCHPDEKKFWIKTKDHTPKWWNHSKWNQPDYPVVGVDWYDAFAYAKWKGKMLPYESLWEKAASWNEKEKKKFKYPWGNQWDHTKLHHYNNGARSTAKVMSYPAGKSPYGCFDMAGNVWEWVYNWHQLYPRDLHHYNDGLQAKKIARGGSWGDDDKDCDDFLKRMGVNPHYSSTTYRYPLYPITRKKNLGFRCAMEDFDRK